MKKIGVISDTHGVLRPEVVEALTGCDVILHAGDVDRQEILGKLQAIAPVYVVRGNNDTLWIEPLPYDLEVKIEGLTFYMIHDQKEITGDLSGVDVVICGHTHKYRQEKIDGRLWLNPGNCGKYWMFQDLTMSVMTVDGREYEVKRIDLPVGKDEKMF